MSNKKATKRALLSSIMAIFLCLSMLVGTTFAWFTDSASTAVNKIQSGTLEIELQYATAWDASGVPTAWADAEGKTLNFRKAAGAAANEAILWEPGCTYKLPELRIVNKGNLALQYKILITGIAGDAKLNEVIDWEWAGCAIDENGVYEPCRGGDLSSGDSIFGSLKPNTITDDILISGSMKKEAGNEYQGKSIDGIGITVVATQDTVEHDSNGNTYDERAEYPVLASSVSDFRDALSQGNSTIILASDVTVEDGIQMSVENDASINFNGNTLKGAVESGSISSSDGPTNLVLSDPNNSDEYSIDGELVQHAGGGYTQLAAITVWKRTVTIESGKYTHDNAVILCQLQTQDPDAVGVVVNGGTFDGKGAASVIANVFGNVIVNDGEFNAHYDGEYSGECVYVSSGNSYVPSVTTINGGTFNADKRVFYVRVNTSYTQKIVVNGGTFNVAEGGSLIQVSSGNASDYLTITGGTFNVNPSAYVDTANYNVTHSGSTWTVTAK